MLSHFSHVRLFATPWTVAHQVPLSMGFSRQEYWSGLPCPPPEDLPSPGIEPTSLKSLHWQVGSLPLVPPGKPSFIPWKPANIIDDPLHPHPASAGQHTTRIIQNKECLLKAVSFWNVRQQIEEGNIPVYVLWTFQIFFPSIMCSSHCWCSKHFLSPAKIWGLGVSLTPDLPGKLRYLLFLGIILSLFSISTGWPWARGSPTPFSAPAERTVSHRWVQPSKQDLETHGLQRTCGHRYKSEALPAGHVAHNRSQISLCAHGSWAESKQWFSSYCFSLSLLFTERIWGKLESGKREKQISCGRQDSSQLWSRKYYLSLFWSS